MTENASANARREVRRKLQGVQECSLALGSFFSSDSKLDSSEIESGSDGANKGSVWALDVDSVVDLACLGTMALEIGRATGHVEAFEVDIGPVAIARDTMKKIRHYASLRNGCA